MRRETYTKQNKPWKTRFLTRLQL